MIEEEPEEPEECCTYRRRWSGRRFSRHLGVEEEGGGKILSVFVQRLLTQQIFWLSRT